ncbi:MAG: hypothetical protein WCJ30_03820, partial [Deltaproteobacteria bacterium]
MARTPIAEPAARAGHRGPTRAATGLAACLTALTLLAAWPCVAEAQVDAGTAPACTCSTERAEIAALLEARHGCEAQRSSCDGSRTTCLTRAERLTTDLGEVRHDLDNASASSASCQASAQILCRRAGEIVADVVQLRSELPEIAACVPPASRRAAADLISSWRNGRLTLQRLEAYSRGDVAGVQQIPGALVRGEIEALALRLAGTERDAPLVYRRLLVETVQRLAPGFWASLRQRGRDAVDEWFASTADLDAAFIAEVQAELAARSTGPSQSAALRFVRTFEDLMGCEDEDHPGPRQCARAAQLRAFLESSTALIARQRVHEIWQAACSQLAPDTVRGWLREFPSAQPTLGRAEWSEVVRAAYDKLVTCYLADSDGDRQYFPDWLTVRLPAPMNSRVLGHLDELRALWSPASPDANCLRSAQMLRTLAVPSDCSLPAPTSGTLQRWFQEVRGIDRDSEGVALRACSGFVDAVWRGAHARVLDAFPGVPSPEEVIQVDAEEGLPSVVALRAACAGRAGSFAAFPGNLRAVARVAETAREDVTRAPWSVDPLSARPVETAAFERALTFGIWLRDAFSGVDACGALGVSPSRCRTCSPEVVNTRYECALLTRIDARWRWWQRLVIGSSLGLVFLVLGARWGFSLGRSLRALGRWRRDTVAHLRRIGLSVNVDPMRFVFPSRMSTIRLGLPGGPWERWGTTMAIVHADRSDRITESDVQRAALAARAQEGEIAMVTHDESASPNLAAVRAMLDWAARGPRGAVQILPVSSARLQWANSTDDLLDLVEQTSLRGNPFEVRGRLVSSSQFFNRERLVSGLLAATQAGSWTVITGLRRFGKSSLALEVARKLQAPYAYVDLAGFHHEITSGADPV